MRWASILMVLCVLTATDNASSRADEAPKGLNPKVHRNHVTKTSAKYVSAFRRIVWHYDFATATEVAQQTGRPMWVIFCRGGEINDPITGKLRCSS